MIRIAVLAASLVAVVSGCSAEAVRSDGLPEVGEVTSVSAWADGRPLPRPLDALSGNSGGEDVRRVVWAAENLLVNECLAKFGFHRKDPRPMLDDADFGGPNRLYGITDAAKVRKYGYHPAPGDVRRNENQLSDKEPSEEELAIEEGEIRGGYKGVQVPKGGCLGDARRQLFGNMNIWTARGQRMQAIVNEAAHRAEDDPRVRAVFQKWSSCMQESGYHYTDPWEANNDPRWLKSEVPIPPAENAEHDEHGNDVEVPPAELKVDRKLRAEEITAANADLSCRKKHNVVGVWHAVDVAYQKRAIDANAEFVQEQKKAYEVLARRASAIVGR